MYLDTITKLIKDILILIHSEALSLLRVPGSGKSFGVINPSIRQMIAKGFCLCIYDFKFPDLAQIAYYHYLLKKSKESDYNYNFHIINLNEVEKSRRVNPFHEKYIQTLADAQEMAESMVSSLQKVEQVPEVDLKLLPSRQLISCHRAFAFC
ncbi:hypothetical protein [Chryseobacterium indoltheticum]|uniref:hypothetical protein n=1 Tax=Chryseobacterium indoltheticum TaxID=254 RepID=UPI003F492C8A